MSSLVDCCSSCCTTPAPVYVVGSTGATGVAGADGVNAFTTLAGNLLLPAAAGYVVAAVTVLNGDWIAVGQTLLISDGANIGTFRVDIAPVSGVFSGGNSLYYLDATNDTSPGTIVAPANVAPAGVPGVAVADPLPVANGGTGYAVLPAQIQVSPADPAATVSATEVMMGLGATASITPTTSGKVFIVVTGMIANAIIGKGSSVQLRYGTGVAPINGAAPTGTALGSVKNMVEAAATCTVGFALSFVVTGLAVSTAYWIDCSLFASGGGGSSATITDLDIVATEL